MDQEVHQLMVAESQEVHELLDAESQARATPIRTFLPPFPSCSTPMSPLFLFKCLESALFRQGRRRKNSFLYPCSLFLQLHLSSASPPSGFALRVQHKISRQPPTASLATAALPDWHRLIPPAHFLTLTDTRGEAANCKARGVQKGVKTQLVALDSQAPRSISGSQPS